MQEAVVRAFRALGRFRPQAPFRPWLYRIAINEAKAHVRRATRAKVREGDWALAEGKENRRQSTGRLRATAYLELGLAALSPED